MRVCAVIVAGGRSSRMGREKALELLRGRTVIDWIITRLSVQTDAIVLNANGDAGRFARLGLSIINDLRGDIGTPLAGLHAALVFAKNNGFDAVLTAPSDAPFLPADLLQKLLASDREAAIAASAGQSHYLTGLWSPALLPAIEDAVQQSRTPRLQDWCRTCSAAIVEWTTMPYDPFFNINTPEELAEAERIAAVFNP
ncbi:MAG: molybdenum cofactor guanylyltransferase [Aestuariivirga sp.]|uniref:molybdenum cofactor guanylyltransferase n=1 Tax=Aestuariivirga sp. TaxID=2650926 RepID=UPI003017F45A